MRIKKKQDIRESCPKPRLREMTDEQIEAANKLVPDLIKATNEYERNLAAWDGNSDADFDSPNEWYVGDELFKFLRKMEITFETFERWDEPRCRHTLTPGVAQRVNRVVMAMRALYEEVEDDIRIVNAAAKAVNLMDIE